MKGITIHVIVSFYLLCILFQSIAILGHESSENAATKDELEEISVDPSKVEYAKGSVCGYCTYCKFCQLCEKDCPCVTSKKKPNCKMCKYCKYCHLCSAVCDTVCTPGGILDRVSGAIVNSLPSFNKDEVDSDIHSVRDWIKRKKDEL